MSTKDRLFQPRPVRSRRFLTIWLLLPVGVGVFLPCTPDTYAGDNLWTNPGSGSWEVSTNWIGGTPESTDNIFLTNAGTYTVTIDNTTANTDPGGAGTWLTVSNIIVGNSSGLPTLLVDFTNATKTLTLSSATALRVGNLAGRAGTFVLANGTVDATGVGDTRLGESGVGTMIVSNGSYAANLFRVGFGSGGAGTLKVYGGSVDVQNQFIIANSANSTGAILVAGGNLSDSNSIVRMGLGNLAQATLTVSNGMVNFKEVRVGENASAIGNINIHGGSMLLTGAAGISLNLGHTANGTGNVLVTGGELRVDGPNANAFTFIGFSGVGMFTLSNGWFEGRTVSVSQNAGSLGFFNIFGGTATVRNVLSVGANDNRQGHLLISDSGILELRSSVNVGGSTPVTFGVGTLTNQNGGTLRFTGQSNPTITIGSLGGTFVVTNAVVEFKDTSAANIQGNITNITFLGNNALSLNNASNAAIASYTFQTNNLPNFAHLKLSNGGRFQSTTVTVGPGGSISGEGTVSGTTTVQAGGKLSPGNSPGVLIFGNGLTMESNSVMELEIGSIQYDQVSVVGSVNLSNSILQIVPTADITTGIYTIVVNDLADLTAGEFQGLTNNAFLDASSNGFDAFFRIQYNYNGGNDVVLLGTIPEPSVLTMTAVALAIVLLRRRR